MNPAKELGKRRRDDEVPTESSQLLHISPPPGALTELECLIDGDSIEDGRVHLSKEFTKKLVNCLGLPSGINTALRQVSSSINLSIDRSIKQKMLQI
jgi:hypothetical protein